MNTLEQHLTHYTREAERITSSLKDCTIYEEGNLRSKLRLALGVISSLTAYKRAMENV